jgi:DNA-binding CsgD family transcriptional regulator
MSLTLSSRECALLGEALAVVSSPLDYVTTAEWHAAVRHAIEPLLGTGGRASSYSLDDEPAVAELAAHDVGLTAWSRPFHQRAVRILELLRPSFRASVATLLGRGTDRGAPALADLVDALPAPAVLCSATGQLLHESPALRRLLAAEPLASRVRAAIRVAARVVAKHRATALTTRAHPAGGEPAMIEVRGALLRYELRGALLIDVPRVATVFLVRAAPPRALSDVELRERFALTAREIEVLRLLAVGRSAREVSVSLGLSYYTARHHVEHVLAKLGVRTRAAVAAATEAGGQH